MFSTTFGISRPTRLRGLKRPPRDRSSQKVELSDEKSYWTSVSGVTNSMSKATICCLRRSRWEIRKRAASVGEEDLDRVVEAEVMERVVLWTIWWARSSKTEDC